MSLSFFLLSLIGACSDDSPTEASLQLARTVSDASRVDDLTASPGGTSALAVTWNQVSDGSGKPAWYEVRYAPSPMESWGAATVVQEGACADPVKGDAVGEPLSCEIAGLEPGTSYDVQLVSFRRGKRFRSETATRSNVATAHTDAPTDDGSSDGSDGGSETNEAPTAAVTHGCTDLTCDFDGSGSSDPDGSITDYAWDFGDGGTASGEQVQHSYSAAATYEVTLTVTDDDGATGSTTTAVTVEEPTHTQSTGGDGLWISPDRLAALPTSGSAWDNVKAEADGSCGTVDLSDQDQDNNVCVLARALVYARTGETGYRGDVVSALEQIATMGTYDGRALALGRELAAYVIAADLVDLAGYDAALDDDFRAKLRELLTTYTHSGPGSLVECHEDRPNNWGTHCGASRAAVAAYLGDSAELERVARVFKGWVGDRSSYAGFTFKYDLSWHCDENHPVGINPAGCTKDGHPIGGVLPDDQRRGGSFTWPPPEENYVWEGLQGALVQATILHRAGYAAFEWEDQALYRAVRWLHEQASYPAEGDDEWQPHLVNHFYGTSFPATTPARHGKNVGWTDWTHG